MREPIKDRVRLEHILAAIDRIQNNIKDVSLDNQDGMTANQISRYTGLTEMEIEAL